ncbi:serine/threonine-protein kinase pelle-like, partial [Limulus polyphemus]|uniref:Serine/threonine-protein kinase pelle-like n=1 Tax=Limulus polyphemus TaxID=6850 RepID=A0ABM1BWK0_LIMPO
MSSENFMSENSNSLNFKLKDQTEKLRYIYDLPWPVRKELCRVLDADEKWEELGAQYLGFDITSLTLIGRSKSPTDELLSRWGIKNGTINHLFLYLSKMDHQRAMSILKPCVDPKYHCFIRNSFPITTKMAACGGKENEKNISTSPFGQKLTTSDSQSQSQLSTKSSCFNADKSVYGHTKCSIDPKNFNYHKVEDSRNKGSIFPNKSTNVNPPSKWLADQELSSFLKTNINSSNTADEQYLSYNCASGISCNEVKNVLDMKKLGKSLAIVTKEKDKNIGKVDEKQMCYGTNGCSLNNLEEGLQILKISYKDLLHSTDEFSQSRILGRGGFGVVYKGDWKGNIVAVKRLMAREGQDSVSRQQVSLKQSLNEMKILYSHRIDNILPLYGVSLDGPEPCLIYQFMVNGSVEDRLLLRDNTPPLTWMQRGIIAEGTARGLNYLHTTSYVLIHGDVKSANILLDVNMEPKIGDFGLTREGPSGEDTHVKVTRVHGTQVYLPPEYLRDNQLSTKVDVYSYGVVLLELATGLRAFDDKRSDFKYLVQYVASHNSETFGALKDTKAGEDHSYWYLHLLNQGQRCAHKLKKYRPEMAEVQGWFKQIREQVAELGQLSTIDIETLLSEPLSPMQRQILYDIRNRLSLQTPGASGSKCKNSLDCRSYTSSAPRYPVVPPYTGLNASANV